ncbi:hypothetical protein STAN_7086 [Streptomyces sp. CBMAI 2042]|uniref:hypothetical protein n=1 Tax=Streptomyces sp. CBMAI 2042 TaxID=2305222 RepID=UPI000F219BC7|nr:hypothetical protein [Streptomyces sp. CBMAI 2042]RLV64266.1 hypothetical protein STAN_7086 [Streptomyces sp. CBMAI 2042]
MVSESPDRDDPGAPCAPAGSATRCGSPPARSSSPTPPPALAAYACASTAKPVELTTPNLGNNVGGHSVVESKKQMKARGMKSPDRAEGILLAVYEPNVRRRGLIA